MSEPLEPMPADGVQCPDLLSDSAVAAAGRWCDEIFCEERFESKELLEAHRVRDHKTPIRAVSKYIMEHEPHQILGVRRNASSYLVKARYRQLCLRWHPDRNTEDTTAVFQMLQDAKQRIERSTT